MNLQLQFDTNGNVKLPTFILANRDGSYIGQLSGLTNVNISSSLEDDPQVSFSIYKYNNGEIISPYWDKLTNFKLVHVLEFGTWFEATVEENESDSGVLKNVTLTRLLEAELSQIHVYGLNINTEDSVIYDENFKPTVLYNPEDREHSLLDRVISYAPHYSIGYVDPNIRNIQRTFTFNDQTVIDCLKQIAEEESLFIIPHPVVNPSSKNIIRSIDVYDVMSSCNDCGYRGFFTHTCPKCGGHNISEGYGHDTNILVTSDALGNDLTISTNPDSITNCYHLQAGDDIMTAAVRQCNPNGTGYIWEFTREMKAEMSDDLADAINDYETKYSYMMNSQSYLDEEPTDYNALIEKYAALDEDFNLEPITEIIGYPDLIKAYYDSIDFQYYLKTSLMPSISTDNITAQSEATRLYQQLNNTTVAVGNLDNLSLSAASTAVMNNAKLIANTIYEVTVFSQSLSSTTWTGVLNLKNFYDKDDTANTATITVTINDNLQAYVSGKVMKTLYNTTQGQSLVVAMFNQTLPQVRDALKLYSLDELNNINKAFNGAIEILSKFKADTSESELYNPIYVPTKAKLNAVQAELALRETELNIITDFVNYIFDDCITDVQVNELNFQKFLDDRGDTLWTELNSFRREANFSDDNYVSTTFRRKFSYTDSGFISDSLTNAEIIQRAYEFLVQAEQKMNENNQYSYQINSSLKNLLIIPDFKPLVEHFACGNWIRVKTDNGELYKLRLISYEMNFDSPESLTVSFSDVTNTSNIRSAQQIIAKSVDIIKNPKRYSNNVNNKFTSITDDIQCDYVVGDSFSSGSTEDNIEILGDQVVTEFNVLDGLIQGKISSAQALSLIQQELEKITLMVQNGYYDLVVDPASGSNPWAEGWYEWDEYSQDYVPTYDTTVDPNKDYYAYKLGASSITIEYNGIKISSPNITLGGTVTFNSELADGTTVIDGACIQTGEIKSANYIFRTGEIYSDSGSLFSLVNGIIRTPGFYVGPDTEDPSKWVAYIKDGGYIGDTKILTANDGGGNSSSVRHAHHCWKLRSAALNEEDTERYYAYLTANKNFIVSNDELHGHDQENDVTYLCSVGSKKFPWNSGYFKELRVCEFTGLDDPTDPSSKKNYIRHNVLPEGLAITLPANDSDKPWNPVTSTADPSVTYYKQVHDINGMKGDIYLYIATDNNADLDKVYTHQIEVDTIANNKVTFLAKSLPTSDINIILLVEDFIYSDIEVPILNASYDQEKSQLSCYWSSPSDSSKFITWLSDELIIEKCIDPSNPDSDSSWQQVLIVPGSGEEPFEPNEFEDEPLVIGNVEEG